VLPVSGRAPAVQPVGPRTQPLLAMIIGLGCGPRPAVILSRHGAVCATGSLLAPRAKCFAEVSDARG